jgi:hypothetical protein
MKNVFAFFVLVLSLTALAQNTEVPNPEAFYGWQAVTDYTTSHLDLSKVPKIKLNCAADPTHLYPTHPQQDVKSYHRFNSGTYDHSKLTAESPACKIASKFKAPNAQLSCLSPDIIYDVIISDVYQDRCGHWYRGYWQIVYFKSDENMGTLFSKGRTLYERPHSQFPNDFVVGNTYVVSETDFMFLSPIFNSDTQSVAKARNEALRTHSFDSNTLIYNPK